jgi:hypothetical protein
MAFRRAGLAGPRTRGAKQRSGPLWHCAVGADGNERLVVDAVAEPHFRLRLIPERADHRFRSQHRVCASTRNYFLYACPGIAPSASTVIPCGPGTIFRRVEGPTRTSIPSVSAVFSTPHSIVPLPFRTT